MQIIREHDDNQAASVIYIFALKETEIKRNVYIYATHFSFTRMRVKLYSETQEGGREGYQNLVEWAGHTIRR